MNKLKTTTLVLGCFLTNDAYGSFNQSENLTNEEKVHQLALSDYSSFNEGTTRTILRCIETVNQALPKDLHWKKSIDLDYLTK